MWPQVGWYILSLKRDEAAVLSEDQGKVRRSMRKLNEAVVGYLRTVI